MPVKGRGEYGEDDAKQALRLTDSLLRRIEVEEKDYAYEKLDIFTADVEAAVERFAFQYWAAMDLNLPLWCVGDPNGEPIPVDWSYPFGSVWMYIRNPGFPYRDLFEHAYHSLRNADLRLTLHKPGEAMGFLAHRLSVFLTVRFGARQSDISDSPGLRFRVITHRHGLRVHYTPSYFFNPSNVFGSPTSPVDGWIQPGRYKFGAMGLGFPLVFDPADFDIPPLTQAQLVNI